MIPQTLADGLQGSVDYYSEHLDRTRFPVLDSLDAFRDFVREKYRYHTFDLVIAIDGAALQFVDRYRGELFGDAPVVFFSSRPVTRRPSNATGVIAPVRFDRTVELALRLQPDTRRVFVVSGASVVDMEYQRLAQEQLRPLESRVAFTYLSQLSSGELDRRLAALPDDSVVYYLLMSRDGGGNVFHPLTYVDRVTRVARVPTYCWVDSAVGHGVVGGHLKRQEAEAQTVARLALRVLRGERADSIGLIEADLDTDVVDWRQLRRWGISEDRIPAGTAILFREPTLWERYTAYIAASVLLLLGQSVLIAILLIQTARRRRAEQQARSTQHELRATSQQLRDLAARLLDAQEGERSRIARELHDDLGQQAAFLSIDLSRLSRGSLGSKDAARLATRAFDRANTIATSLQRLSHRLHPATLQLTGLVAALDALRRDSSHPGVQIAFSHYNVPARVAPDVSICLYRIAQEALANALKHSGATQVDIYLSRSVAGLSLTIVDDGVGFDVDAARGHGLGLISITERLGPFSGVLDIRSAPGEGTRLHVVVPYAPTGETQD